MTVKEVRFIALLGVISLLPFNDLILFHDNVSFTTFTNCELPFGEDLSIWTAN